MLGGKEEGFEGKEARFEAAVLGEGGASMKLLERFLRRASVGLFGIGEACGCVRKYRIRDSAEAERRNLFL